MTKRCTVGVLTLVAATLSFGCSSSSSPPLGPTRTSAGDATLRALMHDITGSPQTCERLSGRMIGLPADGHNVSSAQLGGLALLGGRWAIRNCETRSDGQSVWLRLGGVGWQWVDRPANGFRVSQYVFFAASVDFRGQLDVAYDPSARLASVWLTPVDEVNARVEALGNINVRPETLSAGLLNAILPAVGMAPDNIARARAGTEGAEQFRDRMKSGMTVTYDTGRQQLDMVLGALPNGVAPIRPFAGPLPWLVNERALLMPGGFQIVGPFDSGSDPFLLAARIEQGPGVMYRAICETDVWRALDIAASGGPMVPLAGAGNTIQAGYFGEVPVQPPACRWVLAVSSAGPAPVIAALLVRSTGSVTGTGVGSAWVRVTLNGFHFNTTKPDGTPWDLGGGAPDPEFAIVTAGRKRVPIGRRMPDTFGGAPMVSSELVEVSATTPLLLEVKDVDLSSDDPMGIATIQLQQLATGREIRVPVVLGGVQTGELRLGVELRPGR